MLKLDKKIFRHINLSLWVIWFLLPFIIYYLIHLNWNEPYYLSQSELIKKNVSQFSVTGKMLVALELFINISYHIFYFYIVHRVVYQINKGEILIQKTLNRMKILAIVTILFAVIEFIITNMNRFFLFKLNDISEFVPFYYLDITKVVFSFVLFSFFYVIKIAIEMKEINDYTI